MAELDLILLADNSWLPAELSRVSLPVKDLGELLLS